MRKIPTKNYFILGAIVIATIILLFYLYLLFQNYKENNSIKITDYMYLINEKEKNDYIRENNSVIIYSSDDKNNFNNKMINIIENYHIKNRILYLKGGNPKITIYKNKTVELEYNINLNNYNESINKIKEILKKSNLIKEVL